MPQIKPPGDVPPLTSQPGRSGQAGLDEVLSQDLARLIYTSGRTGILVTTIASLFVVVLLETTANRRGLACWFCAMAVVLALRAFDRLVWHPGRTRAAWRGRVEIGFYALGVGATAILWVVLPLIFFQGASGVGQAGAAVALAATAGAAPTVLGAAPAIAIGYCLSLLLPTACMFLSHPGPGHALLGALGLADAAVTTGSCLMISRGIAASARLARSNQMLAAEAALQQGKTQVASSQLQAAQDALHEANQSLELRIEERTAELQREIAERKGYALALARLASNDPMTGLLNRTTLSERLTRVLEQAAATGFPVAVLFLDLDGFKQINDVQGHFVGDHVLRIAADRLGECCGQGADVARWGGDEFVIVVAHRPDRRDVLELARTIRNALTAPIDAGARSVRVGVTIGIALYPAHGATQDELIRAADVAMYAGKKEGGGRVTMFDRALAVRVSERHLIEQSLRGALADGSFSIHYQPIVDAASGRCQIMEALLRWTHPERGQIEPALFIPIAEQSGQIGEIGRFVLRHACAAAMLWPASDARLGPPAVSVNISVSQILSGRLLSDVQAALEDSGLPAHRLELEITESMFAADQSRIRPVLEELRARGVRLALDDFGTGFSSLAQLKRLPIDTIKIDKAFIQENSGEGDAIIRAMLLIAQAMRLDVTAEGVETEVQSSMLTSLGATRLQGYLLSRPMHAAKVSQWLLSNGAQDRAPSDLQCSG